MNVPGGVVGRSVLVAAVGGALLFAATLTVSQIWIIQAARPYTYTDLDQLPAKDVAIVPGVGRSLRMRTSGTLVERMRAALDLYRAHKVDRILTSGIGDNGSMTDEMVEMRRWLTVRGVPPEHLLVDPSGFRTLDTMRRAADLLHVRSAVICTQAPHMNRSVFLARASGIDAVGFIAPASVAASRNLGAWRQEALKIVLAVADIYLLHRQPRTADARGVIDGRTPHREQMAAGGTVSAALFP